MATIAKPASLSMLGSFQSELDSDAQYSDDDNDILYNTGTAVAHRREADEPDADLALINRKFSTQVSLSGAAPIDQDALDIKSIAAALKSEVSEYNIRAAAVIRKHMCLKDVDKAAKDVMSINIALETMKSYLVDPSSSSDLLYQTEWAITNMCAGSTDTTSVIVNAGFIEPLASLLTHEDGAVRVQAAWALGNICGDNEQFRNLVLETKRALYDILHIWHGDFKRQQDRPLAMEIAAWAASNMFRYKGLDWDAVSQIPQVVYQILCETRNPQVLLECAWALQRIFKVKPEDFKLVDAEFCKTLNNILAHLLDEYKHAVDSDLEHDDYGQLIAAFLKIFANITSKDDPLELQMVLDSGLPYLLSGCLNIANNRIIRGEALVVVENILAGTPAQVDEVIRRQEGMIKSLLVIISGLGVQKGYKCQRLDAFSAMHNIVVKKNFDHINILVQQSAVEMLCLFMQALISPTPPSHDPMVLIQVIDTIYTIMLVGDAHSEQGGRSFLTEISGMRSHDAFFIFQAAHYALPALLARDRHKQSDDTSQRDTKGVNAESLKRKAQRRLGALMERVCRSEYDAWYTKELGQCVNEFGGMQVDNDAV
ncbi:armadillo-type protein [Polychytrium aggregatum]|uniref:armadillo-type protein n=1 Tax=Polychytrium aggregatum TaxID=110093 RepID=UPI0022FE97B5|nr:armadillo-type protein [Polychytrium aggregatum]KAI9193080.1 armadillo-type protein [Polychytrium aggregatum]